MFQGWIVISEISRVFFRGKENPGFFRVFQGLLAILSFIMGCRVPVNKKMNVGHKVTEANYDYPTSCTQKHQYQEVCLTFCWENAEKCICINVNEMALTLAINRKEWLTKIG